MDTRDIQTIVQPPASGTDADVAATAGNSSAHNNILLRRPAITTFIVLATFLTPVAVIPYVLTRRRVTQLSTKLQELAATRTQSELIRTASLLEGARKEIHLLRRDLVRVQSEQEALESVTRSRLSQLLGDRQMTRDRLDTLPQLGISLANIAAFMHEVALHQGLPSNALDVHGVERLRLLALRLQKSTIGDGKSNS
ncbi:hypothetical protein F5I97DRAFT_935340 [Phlebopus sp. FC_14]|nr:hypothetical protein F5I97DRAFT_935340 [Phlebopus sp. FC_14]